MENRIRSIRIDDYLWEELNKASAKLKINNSALIRIAVIEKLNKILKDDLEKEN